METFRGPRAFQNLEIDQPSPYNSYPLIFSLLEVSYNVLPHVKIPQRRNSRKIPEAKAVSFKLKSTSPHPNCYPNRLNYFDLAGLTLSLYPFTTPYRLISVRIGFGRMVVLPITKNRRRTPGLACNDIYIDAYRHVDKSEVHVLCLSPVPGIDPKFYVSKCLGFLPGIYRSLRNRERPRPWHNNTRRLAVY
jgi:hypothetical protein